MIDTRDVHRDPYKKQREFADFLRQRDAAIRTLDMDYARKMMPGASNDEVRLMALHKARYEMTGMEAELRHASRAWLAERGYGRINGLPWPTDGRLPE